MSISARFVLHPLGFLHVPSGNLVARCSCFGGCVYEQTAVRPWHYELDDACVVWCSSVLLFCTHGRFARVCACCSWVQSVELGFVSVE